MNPEIQPASPLFSVLRGEVVQFANNRRSTQKWLPDTPTHTAISLGGEYREALVLLHPHPAQPRPVAAPYPPGFQPGVALDT